MLASKASVAIRPMNAAARSFASQAAKPNALQQFLFDTPSQNSLSEEFPGVPATKGQTAASSGVQVSKLANGVTIASEDRNGATASVGIYVKAGSRYEVVPGTSYALEYLAYRTTQHRSTLKLARDMENNGATVGAKAGREVFAYTGETMRDSVSELVEGLCEAATAPKLYPWEVAEGLHDLEAISTTSAFSTLIEDVHAAAFGSTTPLGHSLNPGAEGLHHISSDTIRSFMSSTFSGSNIVVSGVNVSHADLTKYTEGALGGIPTGATATTKASAYVGGENLTRSSAAASGVSNLAVAFSAPGLASSHYHALGVLNALLGSSSKRRGSPSQTRVAKAAASSSIVHSLTSFAFSYSDAGVVGIAGSAADADAGNLVALAARILKDAAASAPTKDEVERAKKAYKLAYAAQVEARSSGRDVVGTQLLWKSTGASLADTLKAIDAVSAADVAAVAKAALASPVSIAGTGSLRTLPRYDVLSNMLK